MFIITYDHSTMYKISMYFSLGRTIKAVYSLAVTPRSLYNINIQAKE